VQEVFITASSTGFARKSHNRNWRVAVLAGTVEGAKL
jgi:hypothetical protein